MTDKTMICNRKIANSASEKAVIAGLIRGGTREQIAELEITADLFTSAEHQEAFRAVAMFLESGTKPDAAMLEKALTPDSRIEVELSLIEHVSSANIPYHVNELKRCRQQRIKAAAQERLIQAVRADTPPHELTAIVESIRQAVAGAGDKNRFMDCIKVTECPPSENWLVSGYLPADSLSVMFGQAGDGKSFIAIDMACHVATGRVWCGNAVKQGLVIYIAGEGKNGLAKRFRAWFEAHEPSRAGMENIKLVLSPTALTDPAEIAALVADLRTLPESPVLIVIDTLNRNFGPGDENSTADMTRAVAGMDAIRMATGATVLAVHHSGHGDKGRGRGSSVLFGAIDAEFAVEKQDRVVQIRSTKMKDSDVPRPLAWMLEKQPLPWANADGCPIDSAILVPSDVPVCSAHTARQLPTAQRIALDALSAALVEHGSESEGVVSVANDQWRDAVCRAGISKGGDRAQRYAFQRARDALISNGRVITHDGRYWIPVTSGTKRNKTEHFPECSFGSSGEGLAECAEQNGTHLFRGVPHVPHVPQPANPHTDRDNDESTGTTEHVPHVPHVPPTESTTHQSAKPDGGIAAEWRNSEPDSPEHGTTRNKPEHVSPAEPAGNPGNAGNGGTPGTAGTPGTGETAKPELIRRFQASLKCSWNDAGRLITKCRNPEPTADKTGCANCGAMKNAVAAVATIDVNARLNS